MRVTLRNWKPPTFKMVNRNLWNRRPSTYQRLWWLASAYCLHELSAQHCGMATRVRIGRLPATRKQTKWNSFDTRTSRNFSSCLVVRTRGSPQQQFRTSGVVPHTSTRTQTLTEVLQTSHSKIRSYQNTTTTMLRHTTIQYLNLWFWNHKLAAQQTGTTSFKIISRFSISDLQDHRELCWHSDRKASTTTPRYTSRATQKKKEKEIVT